MNIFYLHGNPIIAVKYLTNKHVVKMVLETAQLLSTATQVLDDQYDVLYKPTHINHPCSIWARQTDSNYRWLFSYFKAISNEYTVRYGKVHKSWKELSYYLKKLPINIPKGPFSCPPKCMPDRHKVETTIQSYRNYYIDEKLKTKEDLDRFYEIERKYRIE